MNSESNLKKEDLRNQNCNWLIVGLGNPGERYESTRHNLGFMVIDLLAGELNIPVKRNECNSLIGLANFDNQRVELAKPQTYINLSGDAIACLTKKENRSLNKIIVIVDDLALPFGSIRIRGKGSDGGHNGLKSIIGRTKTKDFIRLRIGIQPDHPISNTKKFVLENFSKKDSEKLKEVLERSADAIRCVIVEGIQKAMSQFNG